MAVWKKVKVGDFLFEREGRYKPDAKEIQGLQRIDKIDFSGNFHVANKPSKTDMILIKSGDLVISGINVAKGALGVYHGDADVTATIHYSSYTFDESKVSVEFFKRFLKSPIFIQLLKEQVKGGIKTEIKPKHLLPLEIMLPDKDEQLSILSQFQRIENEDAELKHELTRQQALLKKLRQQILQEAIEGKLTADWREQNPDVKPASELLNHIAAEKAQLVKEKKIKAQKSLLPITVEEKPFDLPQGWEWCRLGDVAYGFQYGTSSKSNKSGDVPVLRMGNIQSGEVDWNDLVYSSDAVEIEKYKLIAGDLLFNRTNSRELVGKTALYRGCQPAIYAGYLVRFHMAGSISSDYANIVMNSRLHSEWCEEVRTDALGQSNINATKLSGFRFPLAPIDEQEIIIDKVDKLLALCDELEVQITQNQSHAEQLMPAVLKEAFSHNSEAKPAAKKTTARIHIPGGSHA
ncbi:restriction endonuclease subunit S [Pseudidiomarina sp. GXY010]|uniref:Restriction endonuclease subunit S n=1 Tax=Pseudidiomarina fusca TaxID=2965078 RepID=A0ABU3KZK6_9GAMM|nr:restriction endonuclease subunit S [Pseudidiomarina sp. GXY010]MDT7526890.1 restriction endonuclease subunit S [Pseudidiomarina sp. GXY010]